MPGVLGTGQLMQQGAVSGLVRASALESQRDATNEQIKAGEKSQKIGAVSSGMGTGAAIGAMSAGTAAGAGGAASGAATGATATSWSGPGALIGAAVGAIAGYLLSEVF